MLYLPHLGFHPFALPAPALSSVQRRSGPLALRCAVVSAGAPPDVPTRHWTQGRETPALPALRPARGLAADVFADEPEVPGILTCEAMAAHPQPEEAVGAAVNDHVG